MGRDEYGDQTTDDMERDDVCTCYCCETACGDDDTCCKRLKDVRIAALEADNARLREGLEAIHKFADAGSVWGQPRVDARSRVRRMARAALDGVSGSPKTNSRCAKKMER